MDDVDILICDNKTTDKRLKEYVSKMQKKFSNIHAKFFNDRHHAELYRAMNYGIDFAKKRGADVINFIQDDYQYIRRDNNILDHVSSFLSNNKEIVQVNTNMVWRYKAKKIGKVDHIKDSGINYAVVRDKFACDNGFTRVSVYDKIGSYPLQKVAFKAKDHNKIGGKKKYVEGESWFAKKCKSLSLFRAISLNPNSALIFDCAYVRGDTRHGEYFPPPNDLYIKSLSKEQIDKIKSNHKKKRFSYIEDICEPWGYKVGTKEKHSLSKKKESVLKD
jgi:glycosyltransferase involved in cell wall biosynthesis